MLYRNFFNDFCRLCAVCDNKISTFFNKTKVFVNKIEKNVKKDDLSWAELSFGDASEIAPYALEAVSYFSSTGVINGIEENGNLLFKPGKSVTRAELAKIIYGVDGK